MVTDFKLFDKACRQTGNVVLKRKEAARQLKRNQASSSDSDEKKEEEVAAKKRKTLLEQSTSSVGLSDFRTDYKNSVAAVNETDVIREEVKEDEEERKGDYTPSLKTEINTSRPNSPVPVIPGLPAAE